jgi:hypothetical protein
MADTDRERRRRQNEEVRICHHRRGLAAAVVGLAGPAQADIGHNDWVHEIQQHATVGSITPTFGNGR